MALAAGSSSSNSVRAVLWPAAGADRSNGQPNASAANKRLSVVRRVFMAANNNASFAETAEPASLHSPDALGTLNSYLCQTT
jgi:hypothetical protein